MTEHANVNENVKNVLYAFEFDQHMERPQRVEVRNEGRGYFSVVLTGGVDMHLFGAALDQWGTWYDANESTCVAQEDGTRSFLLALIMALEKVREISEVGTLPPTQLILCKQEESQIN